MKKFILSLAFLAASLCASAQIYNTVERYDKFNDIVFDLHEKTAITVYTDCIVFETKGQDPRGFYRIFEPNVEISYVGSKTNPVNLVKNLYGYETHYTVAKVPLEDVQKAQSSLSGEALHTWLTERLAVVVHRTITTQYGAQYIDDLWWIELADGSRWIYSNE